MIAIQIARLIANFCLFLDFAGEEIIDPDEGVEVTEVLGAYLHDLDKDFLRELVDAFALIADEYTGKYKESVRNIASDFFLEETIAADDPVKLAELEAIRDADDLRYRELNEAATELAPTAPSVEAPVEQSEQSTASRRLRSWPWSRL